MAKDLDCVFCKIVAGQIPAAKVYEDAETHLHLHVVPRFHNDGHRWNWAQKKYDGSAEMEAVAARIRAAAGR